MSLSDMFYDMLTQAIKIGMTPDDFWHGEPSLYYNYLDAYEEKQREEMDKIDTLAWKQGLYVMKAIAVNNPLAKNVEPYPNEPDCVKNKERELQAEQTSKLTEEERIEFEQQLALAQFEEFGKYAELYNKQYFGEEEG